MPTTNKLRAAAKRLGAGVETTRAAMALLENEELARVRVGWEVIETKRGKAALEGLASCGRGVSGVVGCRGVPILNWWRSEGITTDPQGVLEAVTGVLDRVG